MSIGLHVDATRTNRTLVPTSAKRGKSIGPGLQFWRRLIFLAVHDAKRTRCGVPTDCAILARWWIAETNPPKTNKDAWTGSFGDACEHMDCDASVLRAKLVAEIDLCLKRAYEVHVQSVIYFRRSLVLTCAGVPTAIARQYALAMAHEEDYEDVAAVDHGDQYAMYDQREEIAE